MESKTAKTPKHVIILGAGASASSGYPVGNDLRLWMSSPQSLRERIESALVNISDNDKVLILKQFDEWIKPVEKALQLFREGDFASVDEFCRLAGARLQNEISQLKRVLRLALSVHNPEDHYEKSDYYGFVQRLFRVNLVDLREDVVVLSFNYDAYLEFLVQRAVRVREQVTKGKSQTALDLLTSGFSNRNIQEIEDTDGFCLLKLHGAVAWPKYTFLQGGERDSYCWYGDLFYENASKRLNTLASFDIGQGDSPIVFPWEIMDDKGNFMEEDLFPCRDTMCRFSHFAGGYNGATTLFQLFKSIWTRAKAEVLAANKISIVGLSLHEYLKPAFQFLFSGKTGNTQLVVADTCLKKFDDYEDSKAHFDPLSPVARIDQWLREVCPSLHWNEQEFERQHRLVPPASLAVARKPIRIRKSFEEFILNEIDTGFVPKGIIELPSTIESK